ncbi:hypothetical protein [Rubrivirga sp.]|uniref:hypothetical protein n=1 Tax=Rubrivirga sp. TaxID=1885344 RepID=UPI003C75F683
MPRPSLPRISRVEAELRPDRPRPPRGAILTDDAARAFDSWRAGLSPDAAARLETFTASGGIVAVDFRPHGLVS